ncbi:HNH endonuclease [Pseudoduganella aquatica]|uniref:HNH nuclease domain-containing protein n=1 Tax=Pseudoduganella aquatica TaxID=2660641 RepID=A0A7X4HF95_9BURK|nr:HNH endonuclease [Pseudoduganella aquatica]MYN10191.1 hypothetical protein [Pseudoduganella aquatica]
MPIAPLLDASAQRILGLLVSLLPNIKPDNPKTFIGYKSAHERLGLSQEAVSWGDSLKVQGLLALAEWCEENGLPAITGLIIDKEKLSPGKGYYTAFVRREDDFQWWFDEIRKARDFDWTPYLAANHTATPPPPPPESPEASDVNEPAPRCETTTYRVLRDTLLAREVKRWHNYKCQVCGESIALPNGEQYAEAHHIQPLGAPHDGPDIAANIICVCPNHHVELDYGVRALRIENLRQAPGHQISDKYVQYHNEEIMRRWQVL